jgi:hypothetical protein
MCEQVQDACAPYISLLTPAQQAFVDCNQTNNDGTPKFTDDEDCYFLDNLVPYNGCANNSNNTGKSMTLFYFYLS